MPSSLNNLTLAGATVFETKPQTTEKRKRQQNKDPSDVTGYLGPWAKYVDEKTVIKPSEVSNNISHSISRAKANLLFTI